MKDFAKNVWSLTFVNERRWDVHFKQGLTIRLPRSNMKEAWKKFIESSPHNFKFLHLEELEEYNLLNYKNDLPICVEENSGEYKILINKDQMNKYKDEFELINILKNIL